MYSMNALWIGLLLLIPAGCTSNSGKAVAPAEKPHGEDAEHREDDDDDEMEEHGATEASHMESGEHEGRHADSAGERHGELAEHGYGPALRIPFETVAGSALPRGWQAEGTNQEGPLATWKVVEDPSAPSKSHVLALTSPNHDSGGTFNLCWTDQIRFEDGALQVSMKPISGEVDQGGGLFWRAEDKDNYYVCRANPLESNFRLYYVKSGKRTQLATAKAEIEAGAWHTIRIEQQGERIACSLDGKRLLEVSDSTFPSEGGIGLWTKADAATEFDALEVAESAPAKDDEDHDDGAAKKDR